MKAWTLIAFYLSKDIWSRWLEHPGSALARLLVGVLLAALLLLGQAGFALAGRSLETRLARLGAGTLLVTEVAGPDQGGRASLEELLAPAAGRAELIAFRQLPVPARDPLRGECVVLAYGPATLAALAPALAGAKDAALHYVAPGLPADVPVELEIDGVTREAVSISPPGWAARLPLLQPLVLAPEEQSGAWPDRGHLEHALLLADPARPAEVAALAAGVRALLVLSHRDAAQVQGPEAVLAEIDRLAVARDRAGRVAGLAGGLVLALVFGAVAALEYRQNRYVVALLRSFGAPGLLVLLRHAAEGLLLLAFAGLAARGIVAAAHAPLFGLAGFEPGLLDRAALDPYAWSACWPALRWLLAGAMLSVLPIAAALRHPVGRTLQ